MKYKFIGYKFIGTKQDLIDNGFLIKTYSKKCRKEIAGTWYALRDTGVYCEDQKENETIIVFQDSKEISFNGGWMKLYIEDYIQDLIDKGLVVKLYIEDYIQDLIDKGLVVENDLTKKGERK